jgi:hypothetical protein
LIWHPLFEGKRGVFSLREIGFDIVLSPRPEGHPSLKKRGEFFNFPAGNWLFVLGIFLCVGDSPPFFKEEYPKGEVVCFGSITILT